HPDGLRERRALGNPCIGPAEEGDVYIASIEPEPSSGRWRAVAYRQPDEASGCLPAPGAPSPRTHELWARELFPLRALDAGDVDVVHLDGPAVHLVNASGSLYTPEPGDPARGASLEGLPWVAPEVVRDHDRGTVSLVLVRPSVGSQASA